MYTMYGFTPLPRTTLEVSYEYITEKAKYRFPSFRAFAQQRGERRLGVRGTYHLPFLPSLPLQSADSSTCCIFRAAPKCQLSLLGPPTSSLSFFPLLLELVAPGCSLPSACPWLPLWDCLPSDNGPIVLFGTFHPVDFPFWYTWVLHQRIHKWVANTLVH